MELEEALQDQDEPASSIVESIKDLEDEILEATNIEAMPKGDLDSLLEAASEKDSSTEDNKPSASAIKSTANPEKIATAKPSETENKPAALPEIDTSIDKDNLCCWTRP